MLIVIRSDSYRIIRHLLYEILWIHAIQAPMSQLRIKDCPSPKISCNGEIFLLIIEVTSKPWSKLLKSFIELSWPRMCMIMAQPKYSNAPVKPNAKPNFLILMWFMFILFMGQFLNNALLGCGLHNQLHKRYNSLHYKWQNIFTKKFKLGVCRKGIVPEYLKKL